MSNLFAGWIADGSHPYPLKERFWVSWLGLTLLYLAVSVGMQIGFPRAIVGLVGLLVPFGFFNTFFGLMEFPEGAFLIMGMLGAIMYFDILAFRAGIPPGVGKIGANLVFLFLYTLLTDLMLWGTWQSFNIVVPGMFPDVLDM